MILEAKEKLQILKNLREKKTNQTIYIKDSKENTLTDEKEVMKRW